MTEVDKISYAKMFLDKLSDGINPIDDTRISESDIVNNPRISKCFSYVSDILRQVIDNGGVVSASAKKERKPRKKPYCLLPEQAEQFQFSDDPITGSELISRIMAVGSQTGVKHFPKRKMLYWLAVSELITISYENGDKKYMPTPDGEEIGISLVKREGEQGTYSYLLYNNDAQHFIIDNIEAILAFDNNTYLQYLNIDNNGRSWSTEDNRTVVKSFKEGLTVGEIAALVKRSERAVRIRLRRNGIKLYSDQKTDIS